MILPEISEESTMNKHIVNWRPVRTKNVRGFEYEDTDFVSSIECRHRGTLISQILLMNIKAPILFEDAVRLAMDSAMQAFEFGKIGSQPGETSWYTSHFVEWISSLGFHIELTGDEFEPIIQTDKIV